MAACALLDVDGTLLQSNRAHAESWSRAFAEHGYRFTLDRLLPMIGMGGDRILALLAGLDVERGRGKAIAERRTEIFLTEFVARLQPTRGARALVETVRRRGARVAVATSASERELGAILAAAQVADLIEVASKKEDAPSSKPAPGIVEAALRRAGARAAEAVMVGDTPYDAEAAHRAGVTAIGLRCGGWAGERLAADAVYDDPQDLLEHLDASPLGRLLARERV